MQTLKLQLSLSRQGHIKARVLDSPVGEALEAGSDNEVESVRFIELNNHKKTLLRVLESQSTQPSIFSESAQDWLVKVQLLNLDRQHFAPNLHKRAGQLLYNALFLANDNAKQCLHDSRVRVSQKETLHIQFVISGRDEDSASLLEYPWELLHDSDEFLAWKNITFSRYIAYGDSPTKWSFTDKLRVLLVSLDAYDKTLGLQQIPSYEQDVIKASLQRAEDIHLVPLSSPNFREFGRYLLKCDTLPHIIHFDGHGLFGKKCKACRNFSTNMRDNQCQNCHAVDYFDEPQGYILFKGDGLSSDLISAEDLAIELGNANMDESRNGSNRIKLVVLSTCQSGVALDNYTIFNGIAQRLIKFGIPAVIAMQFSVDTQAAADFAERFYTLLSRHAVIEEAMKNGRVGMRSSGKDNQWYRPVLYTRWSGDEKGHFFNSEHMPVAFLEAPPVAQAPSSAVPERLPLSPPVQIHPSVSGSFYESVKRLHAQVEDKRRLLIEASAAFARRAIYPDVCEKELRHLQEVSGPLQELSSCIDRADIGKLTEEENQLRNMLKKPAHDSKGTLDALILQVTGLSMLLRNRGSGQAESFEVKKSQYLLTIQSKFAMLKENLDQFRNYMKSCEPNVPVTQIISPPLASPSIPIKIVFCYAHEDIDYLNKLKNHLTPLRQQGLIDVWYDGDIRAGEERVRAMVEQLNTAHIIVVLVSADFLSSEYYDSEGMKNAMNRHESGEATVIPVILRHVDWKETSLGKLQALPRNEIPILDHSWQTVDEAFYEVTKGIKDIIKQINSARDT